MSSSVLLPEDVETEEIELGDTVEQTEDFELPDSDEEDDSDDELGFYGEDDDEMQNEDDEVDRMYWQLCSCSLMTCLMTFSSRC